MRGPNLSLFMPTTTNWRSPSPNGYPQTKRFDDPRRILEDDGIALVISAAIPCEQAALGISVMRHGKDFMVDKPGMTSLAQLAAVRAADVEGEVISAWTRGISAAR